MPDNPRYVLDSNVIAKWFVQEEGSEKAVEIRDLFIRKTIHVSTVSLARYELGNVLWKHPAKSLIDVKEDFEALYEMAIPIRELEDPRVLTRVFQTARELRITFYDASYVASAVLSRETLLTADEGLYGKLKGREDVVLLKDWKGPARRRRHAPP